VTLSPKIVTTLFFAFYRFGLAPLMHWAFRFASLFNEKIREGIAMRAPLTNGKLPWLDHPQKTRPIWFHCASGEFEYAKPVITALKNQFPSVPILVTYFSPSIAKAARQFSGVSFACPTPWESAKAWREFISWHEPRALLIARTDTWPEMLYQAKSAGIPTLLFSATLPAQSGRAKGLGRVVSRITFQFLDKIFCVTSDDLQVFQKVGCEKGRIEVFGDTRYDQVQLRLKNPKPVRSELFTENRDNVMICGSTWSEDETVLIEVISSLQNNLQKKNDNHGNQIKFVIVPHEPTNKHLEEIENRLQAKKIKSVRYSKVNIKAPETNWQNDSVLLVDQVGILAELYQKGRYAFVGGSYRKTVHSVMEPLAAGCVTIVGPLYQNNREAIEFSKIKLGEVSCVNEAKTQTEFVQILTKAHQIPGDKISSQLNEEISRRTGGSERVVDWCRPYLQ
jgi:3-deoxy-D-manno-octulosonic-acid transferase